MARDGMRTHNFLDMLPQLLVQMRGQNIQSKRDDKSLELQQKTLLNQIKQYDEDQLHKKDVQKALEAYRAKGFEFGREDKATDMKFAYDQLNLSNKQFEKTYGFKKEELDYRKQKDKIDLGFAKEKFSKTMALDNNRLAMMGDQFKKTFGLDKEKFVQSILEADKSRKFTGIQNSLARALEMSQFNTREAGLNERSQANIDARLHTADIAAGSQAAARKAGREQFDITMAYNEEDPLRQGNAIALKNAMAAQKAVAGLKSGQYPESIDDLIQNDNVLDYFSGRYGDTRKDIGSYLDTVEKDSELVMSIMKMNPNSDVNMKYYVKLMNLREKLKNAPIGNKFNKELSRVDRLLELFTPTQALK